MGICSLSSVTSALLYHSLFVLHFILINHVGLLSAFDQKNCRNSCGKLDGISYPLRLKGDPPECGVAEYELVCEAGEDSTLHLYFDSHKYVVTGISNNEYSNSFRGSWITVHVDCPFTTSTCRQQGNSSSSSYRGFEFSNFATFVNCSQRIENDTYMIVPTLSGLTTTVYIIVSYNENKLINLHESCKYLDTFPFVESSEGWNSSKQIINGLQDGFPLYYSYPDEIGLQSCWTYAIRETVYDIRSFSIVFIIFYPLGIEANLFNCLTIKAYSKNKYFSFVLGAIWPILYYMQLGLLALAVLGRFVLAPLSVLMFLLYNCGKNTKHVDDIEKFLQRQEVLTPRRYTYGEIIVMTRHFKEKLGKGGFGSVYKGELLGGVHVAVKVLDSLKFNGEDFINEVATIGRIHHVNIVQLLGFCSDGTKRALIYEYMPNGSLEKYIFSSEKNTKCPLTIDELNNIALGIARGLHYLHTGCDMQILHFDVKPHNILLDRNFTPKLSDFGLAKLFPKENNLVSLSVARGTIGYIAPEVISRNFGVISYKSDVYSFGMLLLEIAGRRRNVDRSVQNSSQIYYPSWIYDNLVRLEVPNFDGTTEVGELERKLCKIGLWCIQINSSKRPSMGEVVQILQTEADDVEMPPKPFFSSLDSNSMAEASTITPSSSIKLSIITE